MMLGQLIKVTIKGNDSSVGLPFEPSTFQVYKEDNVEERHGGDDVKELVVEGQAQTASHEYRMKRMKNLI